LQLLLSTVANRRFLVITDFLLVARKFGWTTVQFTHRLAAIIVGRTPDMTHAAVKTQAQMQRWAIRGRQLSRRLWL
jgi:hypothetical protein